MIEYDEDTHYCIKCSSMIVGLDNYVSHRKTNCGKNLNQENLPKSPLPPSQLLPPEESFGLKADDFFSSLELQSSSKKLPPSTTGKTFSGVLTRSKTQYYMHGQNKDSELQQSKSGKNAWIGGAQLKELDGGDNQSKLIKAVDNLSRTASLKKDILPPYEESEDESDELYFDEDSDSEDDALPRHHTGGKWKPSSPVDWQRSWSNPPAQHTGGKWNPGAKRNSPSPSHTKGKWKPVSPSTSRDDEVPRASYTGGKWSAKSVKSISKVQEWDIVEFDVPPPSHTKGKWKPSDAPPSSNIEIETQEIVTEEKVNEMVPPTTHTQGKWKPSQRSVEKTSTKSNRNDATLLRKSNGRVQYWCEPCNRRLASKIVYERHLKSDLHLKRTLHEYDDSSHLNTKPTKTKTIERDKEHREVYWPHTATEDNKDAIKNAACRRQSRRIRRRRYVKCEVCRSRVHNQLMGKHLISHYHCRKGDITLPKARAMVLENIHSIVLQSPYQCASCRFYCNTQENFLLHWSSTEHEVYTKKFSGLFSCTFCKFQTSDNQSMHEHLLSLEHKEVISVINRSVPIVIKKLNYISCQTCDEKFLLNIQLRKHCEENNHSVSGTASDMYQNRNTCDICDGIFMSKLALQRHKRNVHNDNFYLCSLCDVVFSNIQEAKWHRSSAGHRCEKLASKTNEKVEKKCIYCLNIYENIIALKNHLKEIHPEHKHSCSLCGEVFVIPQDLTVHLRNKACKFQPRSENTHQCDSCPFSTNSKAEYLFHKVLHGESALSNADGQEIHRYRCPVCDKVFSKGSLRCHIRIHTEERPYNCTICNTSFVRKNNWLLHMKNCNVEKTGKKRKSDPVEDTSDKNFLCSTCGVSFKTKSVLANHMTVHTGRKYKCEIKDCIFAARSLGELKVHQNTHSDVKPFQCKECDYKGKTKKQLERHTTVHRDEKKYKCTICPFSSRLGSHLKRHMRLHSGAKPFVCPYCKYRCNNLENLRKHVLATNKHPGKSIYECKFCTGRNFQTNFAKEFNAHLVTKHCDMFQSGTAAASYVAGIYKATDDILPASSFQSDEVKEKNFEVESRESENALLNSTPHEKIVVSQVQEGLFPLYVLSKDGDEDANPEIWSLVASYDESGTLMPLETDDDTLFETL